MWIDHVAALRALNPLVDESALQQHVDGVELHVWRDDDFSGAGDDSLDVADNVIEAFGCKLPDGYMKVMATAAAHGADAGQRGRRPLWITLEYLSAESWVSSHHGLASPPPQLEVDRYFYFPGFGAETGGLLRESDLIARRDRFQSDAGATDQFWEKLGWSAPHDHAMTVSLFGYENPRVVAMLDAWSSGVGFVCVAVTDSRIRPDVLRWLGTPAVRNGEAVRRGNLEVRFLPFLSQDDYDRLLWACDWSFVRGEDSFVRAQWAAKPFVWHIYPQAENAHGAKLEAFLDLYCAGLDTALQSALRTLWRLWNDQAPGGGAVIAEVFPGELDVKFKAALERLTASRGALQTHAVKWSAHLAQEQDLAAKLVDFCQNKRSKP